MIIGVGTYVKKYRTGGVCLDENHTLVWERYNEHGEGKGVKAMKYFWLFMDKRNQIPYGINVNRALDIRYANRENAYKIPDCCVVDMKTPREVFFPNILTEPILMVCRKVAGVIEMYEPDTAFKTIYLLEYGSGIHRTYFMPFLEEVECLSEKTVRSRGGTELMQIVLRPEAVADKAVFRIQGFTHPYLIGRMDFVESILRRDVRGIRLREVEVEGVRW